MRFGARRRAAVGDRGPAGADPDDDVDAERAGVRTDRACAASWCAPSSRMSPSTAMPAAFGRQVRERVERRLIDVGFALYASLRMVMPSSVSSSSMRHRPRSTSREPDRDLVVRQREHVVRDDGRHRGIARVVRAVQRNEQAVTVELERRPEALVELEPAEADIGRRIVCRR